MYKSAVFLKRKKYEILKVDLEFGGTDRKSNYNAFFADVRLMEKTAQVQQRIWMLIEIFLILLCLGRTAPVL